MAQVQDPGAALRIFAKLHERVVSEKKWIIDHLETVPDGVKFNVRCGAYSGPVHLTIDGAYPYLKAQLKDGRKIRQIHLNTVYEELSRCFKTLVASAMA
jgi:hypothetical protein